MQSSASRPKQHTLCKVCSRISPSSPQLLTLDEVKQTYGPVLEMQVCMSGSPLPSLQNVPINFTFVSSTLHTSVCMYIHNCKLLFIV